METRWLEDLVSLSNTRSFRQSAQIRHVTQPAFSRRIKALEAWAGTNLVDRSSYPTRLTLAGKTLVTRAADVLAAIQSARAMMRGHSAIGEDTVSFAAPPALACTFFPRWLAGLPHDFSRLRTSVTALSIHDAMLALVERRCELMVAYHHDWHPLPLDMDRFEAVSIGCDVLVPYAKPDNQGQPSFKLPGHAARALPYLGYKPGTYLGGVVDSMLARSTVAVHLDRTYEADMADCLKAMALEGHGIAFLPQTVVIQELRSRRLVEASVAAATFSIPLSVRAYREKPPTQGRRVGIGEAVWSYLRTRAAVVGP